MFCFYCFTSLWFCVSVSVFSFCFLAYSSFGLQIYDIAAKKTSRPLSCTYDVHMGRPLKFRLFKTVRCLLKGKLTSLLKVNLSVKIAFFKFHTSRHISKMTQKKAGMVFNLTITSDICSLKTKVKCLHIRLTFLNDFWTYK